MAQAKIKIDLRNGLLEVEADDKALGLAMDRAEAMLEKFAKFHADAEGSSSATPDESAAETATSDAAENANPRVKRKKSSGAAKVASWKMVDDLLPEDKRVALKAFFESKKPSSQNEMVAVLSCKLKELTGRDGFDGNEIYTAFQIVGKKTPGNLRAVFGNMTGVGLGNVVDYKFRPNFKADDLVKHDLPPKPRKVS